MKRCKFCGRAGVRMLELPCRYLTRPAPGLEEWACHDRTACARRAAQIGRWVGTRVLRRRDLNGTHWKIYRSAAGTWCLRMAYREHSMLTTGLLTVEAAKAHADDVVASLAARSLREYGATR